MFKLSDSTHFEGELGISVISDDYYKSLEKTAGNAQISSFISDLLPKVKPGKAYFHINAMGAGEYYGANRNGDYFPEEQLLKYYETFVTSPAHLFRHHVNKDPSIANGVVIFATYNHDMHRVELVAEADKGLVQDIENRIAAGDFPSTSMACKTPYDVCSICGNQAHSRAEYCEHLNNDIGKVYPDGRKVMAINSGPLKFFDISVVLRGADPTSFILTKVAGENGTVGSAEIAELEKLSDHRKVAKLTKLSELIKEIDGGVVTDVTLPVGGLTTDQLQALSTDSWTDLAKNLAKAGIVPSLRELAAIYYFKQGMAPDFEILDTLLHKDPAVPVTALDELEPGSGVSEVITKKASMASSLLPEFLEKRAYIGYVGNGPALEDPLGFYPTTAHTPTNTGPGLGARILYAISALGAAVAAYRLVYRNLADTHQEKTASFLKKVAGLKLRQELPVSEKSR